MLSADWNQLLAAFKQKYGEHLHDTVLPAQSHFEAFEDKLSDGNLCAESLTKSSVSQSKKNKNTRKPNRSAT